MGSIDEDGLLSEDVSKLVKDSVLAIQNGPLW